MKEKIQPYLDLRDDIHGTYYYNGTVSRLNSPELEKQGVSLGADKNGFFVFTHRARSKSYDTVEKITKKDIKFIESTG